jgi:uncharacterized protein YbgA (DUF1722 family)/uncharacterized protein YbbK (DUF523 family)
MTNFPRPVLVVSKCLGFAHCRYNGQVISDHTIEALKEYVHFHPVCPEVEIGLGIPRDPIRIVEVDGANVLYQPSTGKDLTNKMKSFVSAFLDNIGEVDGFILKNRSPSCGPADVKVYNSLNKDAGSKRGKGFFGGQVVEGFSEKAIEDEGRLKNFSIREHFLTKLFTLARFREMLGECSLNALIEFHTNNKYLLMAYNQAQLRTLGRIVANHEGKDTDVVLELYELHLKEALSRMPRFTSIINILMHAFGGLSRNLKSEEKRFFLNSIEEYRDERIPLSTLIHLIEAWAIGQNNTYLLAQTFIRPYPLKLVEITDSGKGRDQ